MSTQYLNLPSELDRKFQVLANEAGIAKVDYILDILSLYAESKEYRKTAYFEKLEASLKEVREGKVVNVSIEELEAMTNE